MSLYRYTHKPTNDLQTSYKSSQKNLQKCHNLVDKTKFMWYLVDRPRGHKKTNPWGLE